MRRSLLALLGLLAAAGCGDNLDAVVRDSVAYYNQAAALLERVKSADDAEQIKDELKALLERASELEARARAIEKDKTDAQVLEDLKSVSVRNSDEIKKAIQRYEQAVNGLRPEAREVLKNLLPRSR